MMKRFEKSGKWMGLVLVALGLLFAGCAGPSSEEGASASQSGQTMGIPVEVNNGNLVIGDGSGSAVVALRGHTVEVANGGTACANAGDASTCWIKVVNRDSDEYMVNTIVRTSFCSTCSGAMQFDNADLTNGNTTHTPVIDGNVGAPSPINGAEFCVVEDGAYNYGPTAPFTAKGCQTHAAPVSSIKPYQSLNPSCGARSVLWDFGGQTTPNYRFYVDVRGTYLPWNPLSDGRYEFQDHTTTYIMLADYADKIPGAPNRSWYRLGSYIRSNVLSGYGGPAKATMVARQYFAVNVAIEYPDRIESRAMGDKSRFTNYEYYIQFAALIHYNPAVVQRITANGKTTKGTAFNYGAGTSGIGDVCTLNNCGKGKETYRGYQDPTGSQTGEGVGFIFTYEQISNNAFSYFSISSVYATVNGGKATALAGSELPAQFGHHGVAHLALGAHSYASTGVIQEGVDAKPEMPLAMYSFKVQPTATSGKGSEFILDQYASYTGFSYGWTNETMAGGFYAGTDDWASYCWPMYGTPANQGCDLLRPTSDYIIYSQNENSNPAISQTGFAVPLKGAYQGWNAYLCIQ